MKAVVTGGAGFIGSYLIEKLLQDSHHVSVLDNMSTGRYENIAPFQNNKNFTFLLGDILYADLVCKLVSECDMAYHLVAVVGVKNVMKNIKSQHK